MIARYSNPEMAEIWSDSGKFAKWLEVELVALEEVEKVGLVPAGSARAARDRGGFDLERIAELESEVKHDVIAFVSSVAEKVGPEGRFLHFGMTSSDLVDTALALQIVTAGKLVSDALKGVIAAVVKRAQEFKHTPCIGRSHGIHAEPTTFGLKLLGWATELTRNQTRFRAALEEAATGKISGAVGTNSALSPEIEANILKRLGLRVEPVATQVVPRDRHANLLQTIALIGSGIERACVEIRHLQRSEVFEVHEYFSAGQKGSSAMPHKRNPILSENLSGLARILRANAHTALENIVLWHERDISHSSVERMILPDSFGILYFMLKRFEQVIANLVVMPERMLKNLNLGGGVVFSGKVLLALTKKGLSREESYKIVQRHALRAWDEQLSFRELVGKDPEVSSKLTASELDEVFKLDQHLKHIDAIFARAQSSLGGKH